ncbi:MAG: glutamine synthetase [Gammaproteobacteria bacterium]|nr:glutamine synthetase [Gammaproteobacteria bacterium]
MRRTELERLAREFGAAGVRYVQVQIADLLGTLRTKICPLAKGLTPEGDGLNTALFSCTHGDGEPVGMPVFEAPVAGFANGFPNYIAIADPATVVRLPWQPDTAAVLTNSTRTDGSACPLDARGQLAAIEQRATALGFETRFGLEYELVVFVADDELHRQGRHAKLQPWGRSLLNYDLLRAPGFESLAREFIARLEGLGIGVAAMHTEYGLGMIEYALAPLPALAAADAAVRSKLYLKQLCEERGLIATFMARCRPVGHESASGAHHHQSLLRDGRNVFHEPGAATLAATGLHYAGGLLQTMRDLHVLFRPTVNSYRRMDRLAWSPEDVSWGVENRCTALRAITTPAAKSARIEHRVPGADINPYLTIAAMLAGGLHGIEQRLDPGPPCPGDPVAEGRCAPLPRTLPDSTAAFRDSAFARATFGDEFVEHYALSRDAEWQAWRGWLDSHITEFEFRRYFDSL